MMVYEGVWRDKKVYEGIRGDMGYMMVYEGI